MRTHGKGNIGCIITFIILGIGVYAAVQILPMRIHAAALSDYMEEQATYAGTLPAGKRFSTIKERILAKAKELDIPLRAENLEVREYAGDCVVEAKWEQEVNVLGYVWKMKFNPKHKVPIIYA